MQPEQASKLLERIYLEYEQWGESCLKARTPTNDTRRCFIYIMRRNSVGMARHSVWPDFIIIIILGVWLAPITFVPLWIILLARSKLILIKL